MRCSQAAFDLIVKEEVSSEATYRRKYERPEWPGVNSGATVGIGYDLGQTDAETIRRDWNGRLPVRMVEAMVSASGHTGAAGQAATRRIRDSVLVPWEKAIAVHKECVIPRWEARLLRALPNADKLQPDSFGALLSLIFNRGTSFNQAGDRYKEMRAIKAHMARQNFDAIPDEIRSMKRIWPTVSGLQKRREREALLFERGLRSTPLPPPPDIEKPSPREEAKPPFFKRWWRWITGSGVLGTVTVGGFTLNADIIYAFCALVAVVSVAFLIWVYLVPPRGRIRKGGCP